VFDPDVTPTAITAPDPLNTGTGNEIGSITTPIRAVRLNATITGGNVTMTVIQGRKVGATGGTLVLVGASQVTVFDSGDSAIVEIHQ
jgi:hypothetical protein